METNLINLAAKAAAALSLILFPAAGMLSAQEVAVLPYSVETIEQNFTVEAGSEYAKSVGLAAAIYKDIPVFSFRETMKAFSSQGLDQQGTVTADDISTLCKSRYLSYAVLGRISKVSGGYVSKSILYSESSRGVVAKADVKARTIPELAAREAEELFSRFKDNDDAPASTDTDIAIVLDCSYTMKPEWEDISAALTQLVSRAIDGRPGTRIHLVPFAGTFSLNSPLPIIETVPAMKRTLSGIKLKGGGTGKALSGALNSAIENTSWRSIRRILVLSNSPVTDSSLDRYALRAKQRNISVHSISFGNTSTRDSETLRRLSSMTRGDHDSVSYRQKMFTSKGDEYFVYMQDGRLFEGDYSSPAWKDGILIRHTKGSYYVEPPAFADEIMIKGSAKVTPYTMSDYYRKSGTRSMLNSESLESNAARCIANISSAWTGGTTDNGYLARVLLSSGNNSMWISVEKKKDLDFFMKQKELGFVFPLGVRVILKNDEPFGMTFNPKSFYTSFEGDSLPSGVRVSLSEIQKNPQHYARHGMFTPPVWFVNVKIGEVESKVKHGDLRDSK
jgi:hypothetical protein